MTKKENLTKEVKARISPSMRNKLDNYRERKRLSDGEIVRAALKIFLRNVSCKSPVSNDSKSES